MSRNVPESQDSPASPGVDRRRFLQHGALAAVSATGVLAAQAAPEPAGTDSHPRHCPEVKAPLHDVEGKVAFITGGDSGIGLGLARACVAAGMKVVITYRSTRHLDEAIEQLKEAGDRVHAINVDVTDRPGMERAAEETIRTFGKVHLLVNNAGIGIPAPVSTATFEDWDWIIGANLNGVFNGVRTFLPRLKAHGEGGQIVTTSSMAGLLGEGGVYCTSKFAVVGMMEALRFELTGSSIGVSVYCPGAVKSNSLQLRNRPQSLVDSAIPHDAQSAATLAGQERTMNEVGMDPLEAGELVLRGVRANDLYILTHPEFEPHVRLRHEAIMASFYRDVAVPPQRRALEFQIAGDVPRLYAQERDRRLCEAVPARKS